MCIYIMAMYKDFHSYKHVSIWMAPFFLLMQLLRYLEDETFIIDRVGLAKNLSNLQSVSKEMHI